MLVITRGYYVCATSCPSVFPSQDSWTVPANSADNDCDGVLLNTFPSRNKTKFSQWTCWFSIVMQQIVTVYRRVNLHVLSGFSMLRSQIVPFSHVFGSISSPKMAKNSLSFCTAWQHQELRGRMVMFSKCWHTWRGKRLSGLCRTRGPEVGWLLHGCTYDGKLWMISHEIDI